jgi:hypothetical protein
MPTQCKILKAKGDDLENVQTNVRRMHVSFIDDLITYIPRYLSSLAAHKIHFSFNAGTGPLGYKTHGVCIQISIQILRSFETKKGKQDDGADPE